MGLSSFLSTWRTPGRRIKSFYCHMHSDVNNDSGVRILSVVTVFCSCYPMMHLLRHTASEAPRKEVCGAHRRAACISWKLERNLFHSRYSVKLIKSIDNSITCENCGSELFEGYTKLTTDYSVGGRGQLGGLMRLLVRWGADADAKCVSSPGN